MGLVALLLVLGGGAFWLLTAQLPGARTAERDAREGSGSSPEQVVAQPVAPPEEAAPSTTAAAAIPEPALPLAPTLAAEAPAPAERPALDAGQDLAASPQEDSERRARRQRRATRDTGSEPRVIGKAPASAAPAVEAAPLELTPKPERQAAPALQGSESNPYLRR